MKSIVAHLAALVVFTVGAHSSSAAPAKIIFDTDMIGDFDDVGALACLHALADAGECEILATISSTRGNASVGAVEVINHYYGRGDLPVGAPKGMGVIGATTDSKKKVDPKSPLDASKDRYHFKYRKLLVDYPGWYRHADAENGRHLRVTEKVSKAEVGRVIDELICRKPKHGVKQSKHRHFLRGL